MERPEVRGENRVVHVVEDQVLYDNRSPWPLMANGGGSSLQRRATTFFGNSASSSWFAETPNPGTVRFDTLVVGNLTGERLIDSDDLDALNSHIWAESNNGSFDIDQDGKLTQSDTDVLLAILDTSRDDTNLDGVLDSTDFM